MYNQFMDKELFIGISKSPETAHNVPVVLRPDFPILTEPPTNPTDELTPEQLTRALSSGLKVVSRPVNKK
jgi:hypothetical protein